MVYRQLYHIGHSINKQVCKATNLTYYTPRAEKTSTYKIMHLTQNTKGYASLNISGEGGTPLYTKLTCTAEQGMFFRVSSLYNFPGGTPLYKPYKYVPPQEPINLMGSRPPLRVGFLHWFGLKRGIDFAHFGLESVMAYEGTTVAYQCVRRFNSK